VRDWKNAVHLDINQDIRKNILNESSVVLLPILFQLYFRIKHAIETIAFMKVYSDGLLGERKKELDYLICLARFIIY
jgi:hypothetical protein